jgi:hypothetical protein
MKCKKDCCTSTIDFRIKQKQITILPNKMHNRKWNSLKLTNQKPKIKKYLTSWLPHTTFMSLMLRRRKEQKR